MCVLGALFLLDNIAEKVLEAYAILYVLHWRMRLSLLFSFHGTREVCKIFLCSLLPDGTNLELEW